MALYRDRCVCLRKFEYSETSQILTFLSHEHGIIKLIAKGVHRRTKAGASKFDGGVDLLDIGQAVFTLDPQKDLSTLTEWKLEEGHLSLRRNLRAVYLAQYAAELTAVLFEEHDPHPAVFDRLERSLEEFASPRLEEAFLAFELDLLKESGYLAELGVCASCGQELIDGDPAYFSANQGGIVCRNCQPTSHDRQQFDPRLLRMVQGIGRLPRANGVARRLPRLTRHQTDPINRLFASHIEHTLGRRLKLAPYVLE